MGLFLFLVKYTYAIPKGTIWNWARGIWNQHLAELVVFPTRYPLNRPQCACTCGGSSRWSWSRFPPSSRSSGTQAYKWSHLERCRRRNFPCLFGWHLFLTQCACGGSSRWSRFPPSPRSSGPQAYSWSNLEKCRRRRCPCLFGWHLIRISALQWTQINIW